MVVRASLTILLAGWCAGLVAAADKQTLHVGFAEADITPQLGDKPVYLAGFGFNRKATKVHDPLLARAIVLQHGKDKIALVAVDLVGLFHEHSLHVRAQLPGFLYVGVSSTHNHEGPDSLGLWGSSPFVRGSDPKYLQLVEECIVKAVHAAEQAARPVRARIGTAVAPELLHDAREPIVKHDELVAVQFVAAETGKKAGMLVQWNCHPETLDSKNTEISADFVGATAAYLRAKHGCPVVYLTGTVGGLMTSLHVPIKDEQGQELPDGTFAKTERYGRLVGELTDRALKAAQDVTLTPLLARRKDIYLPIANKRFLLARKLGILNRPAFRWTGDPAKAEPSDGEDLSKPLCLRSEIAWLRLGALDIATIPGEIYPELVLDKVQDPPDAGADFPQAPIEPALYKQLKGPYRILIGLANDEIGYIIPKRQWDEKPPFCYGRKSAQYGEVNSLGPDTAPLLCEAFRALAGEK